MQEQKWWATCRLRGGFAVLGGDATIALRFMVGMPPSGKAGQTKYTDLKSKTYPGAGLSPLRDHLQSTMP